MEDDVRPLERVNAADIETVWDNARAARLDWASSQTWRSDEIGERARQIMEREDVRRAFFAGDEIMPPSSGGATIYFPGLAEIIRADPDMLAEYNTAKLQQAWKNGEAIDFSLNGPFLRNEHGAIPLKPTSI